MSGKRRSAAEILEHARGMKAKPTSDIGVLRDDCIAVTETAVLLRMQLDRLYWAVQRIPEDVWEGMEDYNSREILKRTAWLGRLDDKSEYRECIWCDQGIQGGKPCNACGGTGQIWRGVDAAAQLGEAEDERTETE